MEVGAAVAGRKRLAAAVVEDRIEAAAVVAVTAIAVVEADVAAAVVVAAVVVAAAAGIPVMRAREAETEAAAEMVRSAAGNGLVRGEGLKEGGRGRRRRRRAMKSRLGQQFRGLCLWAVQSVEGRFAGLVVVDAVAAAAGRDTGLQCSTLQPRQHLVAATSGARTS